MINWREAKLQVDNLYGEDFELNLISHPRPVSINSSQSREICHSLGRTNSGQRFC